MDNLHHLIAFLLVTGHSYEYGEVIDRTRGRTYIMEPLMELLKELTERKDITQR